ncbi:CamS family sex pheromone protein [Oceanobacillus senegalensis]|uniref:CamS family sex pheromone protein n=1 Tax=Oceanobacillus senegalensis TaxID=1936063 RepID=UPI000A312EB9|nr:CamS family sex pheromone protein [Oceanobacillus senegalensis]
MRKLGVTILLSGMLLASCSPINNEEPEVVQENEDMEQETSIVPSYQLNDETYRVILPYQTSEARGVTTNQVANRVDIDELEQGLMRHSKGIFDPSKLYFQEGQYLTKDLLFEWIDGLNPKINEDELEELDTKEKVNVYKENPRILSHILEQNYLKRNEDSTVELAGISIGIALKSVYRFDTEIGGPSYYEEISMDEMLGKGREVAQTIVEQMRSMEDIPDVPIMIALFREEEQNSPVPGEFIAKTVVSPGKQTINDWDSINEENILFPSSEGQSKYPEDHEVISSFGNEISEFFPNYVGVVGRGFYINEEMQKLTLEIPIEFYGKAEIIGFTQYVYGLVLDMFPNRFNLEIQVTSSAGLESLITREVGEEKPSVHIFD